MSKAKQQTLKAVEEVLNNLNEKEPLDQNIIKAIYGLARAVVDASAGQTDGAEVEAEADDDSFATEDDSGEVEAEEDGDVDFDDDEEGEAEEEAEEEVEAEEDGDVDFDDDGEAEEETSDDVDFEEEEEKPAKPAKGKAAPVAEETGPDYDSMSANDLYKHLLARGSEEAYTKNIAKTDKKPGLVKLANNYDKLKAAWLKSPQFKKPVANIEALVTKALGEKPSYGRGKSSDDKKKGILADAMAMTRKKPA